MWDVDSTDSQEAHRQCTEIRPEVLHRTAHKHALKYAERTRPLVSFSNARLPTGRSAGNMHLLDQFWWKNKAQLFPSQTHGCGLYIERYLKERPPWSVSIQLLFRTLIFPINRRTQPAAFAMRTEMYADLDVHWPPAPHYGRYRIIKKRTTRFFNPLTPNDP
jgi:hypothetical protein